MEQQKRIQSIIDPLVAWFREEGRELPFRVGRDAYRIWISEIMLQQTRTAAVIPYYERFLARFPSVHHLAEAPLDEVLKLWEGLGYYSRARNLKKCAELLVEKHGGILPRTARELITLPGIGAYTAGAIASIAYGEPEPAVDGNVLRVLMRVLASDRDIADERVKREVAELLRALYPSGEESTLFTEALMELGERICIPNGAPKCEECPICKQCFAYEGKIQALFPVKSPKKPRRIEERTVLLLSMGDRYIIRRRPEGGLLSSLYEFPSLEGKCVGDSLVAELASLGYHVECVTPLRDATHIFTHVEWHMTNFAVTLAEGSPLREGDLALTADEIRTAYAIPSAFRYLSSLL